MLVTFPKATRELRDETIRQLATKAEETRLILREVRRTIGEAVKKVKASPDDDFKVNHLHPSVDLVCARTHAFGACIVERTRADVNNSDIQTDRRIGCC